MKKALFFAFALVLSGSFVTAEEAAQTPAVPSVTEVAKPGVFARMGNGLVSFGNACGNAVYPTKFANFYSSAAAKYPVSTFVVSGAAFFGLVKGAEWVAQQLDDQEEEFEFDA